MPSFFKVKTTLARLDLRRRQHTASFIPRRSLTVGPLPRPPSCETRGETRGRRRKASPEDFCVRLVDELCLEGTFGVETKTLAGSSPPRSACSLLRRGL